MVPRVADHHKDQPQKYGVNKLYTSEGRLLQPKWDKCRNGSHTKPETTLPWTICFPDRTIKRPSSAVRGKTCKMAVVLPGPCARCTAPKKKSIQKMVQCANASSLLKVFACVCSNDPNPFLPTLVTAFAHAMNSHRNSCDWLGSVTQCVLPTYN